MGEEGGRGRKGKQSPICHYLSLSKAIAIGATAAVAASARVAAAPWCRLPGAPFSLPAPHMLLGAGLCLLWKTLPGAPSTHPLSPRYMAVYGTAPAQHLWLGNVGLPLPWQRLLVGGHFGTPLNSQCLGLVHAHLIPPVILLISSTAVALVEFTASAEKPMTEWS